jgi:hypothetical protein
MHECREERAAGGSGEIFFAVVLPAAVLVAREGILGVWGEPVANHESFVIAQGSGGSVLGELAAGIGGATIGFGSLIVSGSVEVGGINGIDRAMNVRSGPRGKGRAIDGPQELPKSL